MSTQAQTQTPSEARSKKSLKDVEAFIFDVFGTVVDWRTSVVRELQELGKKHGTSTCFHLLLPIVQLANRSYYFFHVFGVDPSSVDWRKFAQEWRTAYMQNTCVHYLPLHPPRNLMTTVIAFALHTKDPPRVHSTSTLCIARRV